MKWLTKLILIIMTGLILTGITPIAFAQGDSPTDSQANRVGLRGKVTTVNTDSLTLTTRNDQTITVHVTGETIIRLAPDGENISLAEIEAGNFVGVRGQKKEDNSVEARLVVVTTAEQLRKHMLRGEVLSVDAEAETLTVKARRGEEKVWTVQTTAQTRYRIPGVENPTLADIEVGSQVVILGKPAGDGSQSGVARVIAVLPEELEDSIRLRGEITEINGPSFTLSARRGEVTILTDESTRYRTRGDQEVSFEDLEVGSKVVVAGQPVEGQERSLKAQVVGILPAQ